MSSNPLSKELELGVWLIEEIGHGVCPDDETEKSCKLAELEQLIREKQIEVLQMLLDSAHDQEEASEYRWSRGTFIKAINETIDDLRSES